MNSVATALIWIVLIAAYWAPAITAGMRHVPNTGSVVVINLFTGWTVIGWIIALAMACRSIPATQPPVTFTQNPPPVQPGPDVPSLMP